MSYRQESGWVSTIFGLFILLGIASTVAEKLHINVWLSVAALIGLIFGLVYLMAVFADLSKRFRKYRAARKRCPHGVRAGTSGSCQTCRVEEQQRNEAERLIREKLDKQRSIVESAQKLRRQELKLLSEAWLAGADSYFTMNSAEFERAVVQIFRLLGYDVVQTPLSNDGGKDAIAKKDGKTYVIECKRYSQDRKIGRRDLQILVAAMQDEDADAGFYVNTGTFTRTAIIYAAKNSITLYDKSRLPTLV